MSFNPIISVGKVVVNLNSLITAYMVEYDEPDSNATLEQKDIGEAARLKWSSTHKVNALLICMTEGKSLTLTDPNEINEFLSSCRMRGMMV